jgi:hypothetical protein
MRAAPIFFLRGAPVLRTPALSEGPCGTVLTSRATNRSSRFWRVVDKTNETTSRLCGLLKGRFGWSANDCCLRKGDVFCAGSLPGSNLLALDASGGRRESCV